MKPRFARGGFSAIAEREEVMFAKKSEELAAIHGESFCRVSNVAVVSSESRLKKVAEQRLEDARLERAKSFGSVAAVAVRWGRRNGVCLWLRTESCQIPVESWERREKVCRSRPTQ